MGNKQGQQTIAFTQPPVIKSWASIVGPKEGEGPHKNEFDQILPDYYFGNKSWEMAESALVEMTVRKALEKKILFPEQIDLFLAGDLINQIMPSNLAARQLGIPFLGLFGACSTMAESMIVAAMSLDGGFAKQTVSAACSHHYTAGRQYRSPSEQGVQFPIYSQWTVTGSGAIVMEAGVNPPAKSNLVVTQATIGKVVDKGQNDPANMGAAMAPAACDTLKNHFQDLNLTPDTYDLILTGDLGKFGKQILLELWNQEAMPPLLNYQDAGDLIFSPEQKDINAGGSGCGCSASMLCGPILNQMQQGKLKKILFIATGALMSPTSCFQGETIPGIAHAVVIEAKG